MISCFAVQPQQCSSTFVYNMDCLQPQFSLVTRHSNPYLQYDVHSCIHTYVYAHIHTCIQLCRYAYRNMYTHTQTHIIYIYIILARVSISAQDNYGVIERCWRSIRSPTSRLERRLCGAGLGGKLILNRNCPWMQQFHFRIGLLCSCQ